MARFKVVITDFDYGDNDIERAILEPVGAEVVALQAKSEDDLARRGARLRRGDEPVCPRRRQGDRRHAALQGDRPLRHRRRHRRRRGGDGARHPGHQCARLLHRGGGRPCDRAVAGACAQALPIRPRHPSGRLALEVGTARPSAARPDDGHRLVRQDRPGDRRARASLRRRHALVYDPYLPDADISRPRASSRYPRTSCSRGQTC